MLLVKVKTVFDLGFLNLGRVFIYKLAVKFRFNPVQNVKADVAKGDFFLPYPGDPKKLSVNSNWINKHTFFSYMRKNSICIPEWHTNILTNKKITDVDQAWFQISDFNSELGDIKGIWEASRFDWVLVFAQAIANGDDLYRAKLNRWLLNWLENNKPYLGPNWKCGQEASIRVLHLAFAALLLGQTEETTFPLLTLIKAHLKRISPTIMYAIAQDNNHGTSEAAALYVGGSWLAANGDKEGIKWQKQGDKWLENRAKHLIEKDGSFSQYSTTYHRLMLDTYSMVEIWRKSFSLPKFTNSFYSRLKAATYWLYTFTQFDSGDAPNLGANDGARLLPLVHSDYRDFRPSVQLSACLFFHKSAYGVSGNYDIPLQWLDIQKPIDVMQSPVSCDFVDGGYACLIEGEAFAILNYPKFRFRPSQCDVLHVDFWHKGKNILRDGGTYSYNAGQDVIDYYGGVQSHNTIEFDCHDQMPRLSRFLLGGWLKAKNKETLIKNCKSTAFSVGYIDRFGCKHHRKIEIEKNKMTIVDTVSGFKKNAILRWRLLPAEWSFNGTCLSLGSYQLTVSSSVRIKRQELVQGVESRYYYRESVLPVFEVEIEEEGVLTTEVHF